MTEAANAGRKAMWLRKAREANPALDDRQIERLARHLEREHCRKMARLSAQARRIRREMAALDAALEDAGTA